MVNSQENKLEQDERANDDELRETDGYKLGWMEGMQEGAELATGGEKTAADVEAEFASLLPGPYYMDPPDGGSPSVFEQISRMAEDAAKYRASLAAPASAEPAQQSTMQKVHIASVPGGESESVDTGGLREAVARAIWNVRREEEDRCDMELEDMGEDHPVWDEADAVIAALGDHVARQVQAARDQATQWISVDERLPEGECLAVYVTPNGKQRLIRAKYAQKFQIEAEGDDCETEYNEEDDTFYIKAGWLECIDNWGEYSSCYVVEGVVTHWMLLPSAPQEPASTGKGVK